MSKFLKATLITGGVITALGILLAGATVLLGYFDLIPKMDETYTSMEFTSDEQFSSVEFEHTNMDVVILPSDSKVTRVSYFDSEYLKHNIEIEDDTLKISAWGRKNWFTKFISFSESDLPVVVKIPKQQYETFNIENQSGEIDIQGLFNVRNIKATTTGGEISVSACYTDSLEISAVSGDVSLSRTRTDIADITTTSGKIDLDSLLAEGDVSISTTSGGISSSQHKSILTSVNTASGDVEIISGTISQLQIEGTSSDVNLKDVKVKLESSVTTTSGDVEFKNCSFGYPKFSVTTTSGKVTGTVGSCVIDAKSNSGDVTVVQPIRLQNANLLEVNTNSGDINLKPEKEFSKEYIKNDVQIYVEADD